ncbi:MAG: 2-oxo acid dehydrogenase subunit E2 [Solobacterium sp.]|nr:2-oxo acid dehydrogenase subunit E2 [Solobacterium sp.]
MPRKEGDFREAVRVKEITGLGTVMMHLMPKRTDSEVFLQDTVDVTELARYLRAYNEAHPEEKVTVFHAVLAIIARVIRERPVLNRFIQGRLLYQRRKVSLSFVARRVFKDQSEESLMVLVPEDDDNLFSIARKVRGDVKEMRRSEHSTGGIDKVLDLFAALPRPLLMPAVGAIKALDFWGMVPDPISDGDPNYTSVLLSNLGSIKGPAVYHHLNNYGTCSIMITVGTVRQENVLQDDGTVVRREVLDIGATIDERIGDGFYFIRSLRLLHHIAAHPELLEKELGENSGYDYH